MNKDKWEIIDFDYTDFHKSMEEVVIDNNRKQTASELSAQNTFLIC